MNGRQSAVGTGVSARRHFWSASALALVAVLGLDACQARPAAPQAVGGNYSDQLPLKSASVKTIADFSLTDQRGQGFRFLDKPPRLSLVSFLYTHCTDVCPFTALKMKLTMGILGKQAADLRLVAISTDPERDTPAVVAEYSRALGLDQGWYFLTGSRTKLEAVWQDFGVAVGRTDPAAAQETAANASELGLDLPAAHQGVAISAGLPSAERALGEQVAGRFGGGYELTHSTPFWIVDAQGRLLSMLGPDTSPADLAAAVATALSGGGRTP